METVKKAARNALIMQQNAQRGREKPLPASDAVYAVII